MSFIDTLKSAVTGAATGVTVITALPIFGAVGAITAVGISVGAVLGAVAGVADELSKDDD